MKKSLNYLTTNTPEIYPYNKKYNNSHYSEKPINKTEENKIPLTQRQKSIHFFIDDSLSRLREYIKTPKPYIISKPIRIKMKYIKMKKKKDLEKFYKSSIKSASVRVTKNNLEQNIMKKEPLSDRMKTKNKNKKLSINLEDNYNHYKTVYKIKKTYQNNFKSDLSKKIISNISNIKTNYSSIPNDELLSLNYHSKDLYDYNDINKRYDESDSLGYKNFYVQDPYFAEKGVIKSFIENVNNLRKDYYKNYYLKLNEFKTNILNENKLSQIQFNNRNYNQTKYYLDKYNNGFNIYWYKLNRELKRETENIDNINYKIKEIRVQINKLSNKIQKKLIKIIDINIIREYFKEMKYFSTFQSETPYHKLVEIKNEILKKIEDYEDKTNYIRYLLNDKDLAIYSFIEENKEIFNNKNINNIINSEINEYKHIPELLNMNIKNLLMREHYLEKEIDSLKYILSDLLKDKNENKYYKKIIKIENNNCIKKLSQLKTEREYFQYKIEYMKNHSDNNIYGKLNKNIRAKILELIKTLQKNNYITEEEKKKLNEVYHKNKMKYFIECMRIIEKKINLLKKFEEDIINRNEEIKNIYMNSCQFEEAKRKKLKEIKESIIKKQNIKLFKLSILFFFANTIGFGLQSMTLQK